MKTRNDRMVQNKPVTLTSDGSDFVHRQQVALQYQISSSSKIRLKYCLCLHYLLFVFMAIKLVPDMLDKLDIFVLEIEELNVPQPLYWEYIWFLSILSSALSISAMRKNNLKHMKYYVITVVLFDIVPLSYAFFYYLKSICNYFLSDEPDNVQMWKGYPYGLLWYAFIVLALQVHFFSLYFAQSLVNAWRTRSKKHQ